MTRYRTILFFGAPGSGKGTQGKILGKTPGFYHCACGDVFRSLDPASELGAEFLEYSSKGKLVPDEITVRLWHESIRKTVESGKVRPDRDYLILDGIPRNVGQAALMEDLIEVRRVFHLSCPDRDKLVARHAGNAATAFATAASTSATEAKSTAADCSPVAGLKTFPDLPEVPATTVPLIQCEMRFILPSVCMRWRK